MKEEILSKISSVQSVLENTVYPLKTKLDRNSSNIYWDILEFIDWVKEEHKDEYDNHNQYGEVKVAYDTIDDFGHTYVAVFNPFPKPILHNDGILGISVPLEKMIKEFYDYVIATSEEDWENIKSSLLLRIKEVEDKQKIWDLFQGMDAKISDVHGALFKKEKTKKDKTEIVEGGITLRLLKSKR